MNRKRRPLVAGNWKMNKGPAEAGAFALALLRAVRGVSDREIVVFPQFTAIPAVSAVLRGSDIAWGAQNLHSETSGAFTGETSPGSLCELGCRYVLVGHSERRALFGETDAGCAMKAQTALRHKLTPVVCIGESLAEREAGQTEAVIGRQLAGSLSGRTASDEFVLAYEPVWAIGTGRNAAPEQAAAAHRSIRDWLAGNISVAVAESTRIVYGGSVTPDSIDALAAVPDVDGVLVGGASLDVARFARIVRFSVPNRPTGF
jgi:triosephosphate isomerase